MNLIATVVLSFLVCLLVKTVWLRYLRQRALTPVPFGVLFGLVLLVGPMLSGSFAGGFDAPPVLLVLATAAPIVTLLVLVFAYFKQYIVRDG